ncbi:MAG TPA: hypothetical protein VFY73_02075 [Ideonella sp.]|uniref:hypothetical protein n=1 Tax=Ideonella sp. TaxID=1929293 RepID=UPI002E31BD9F|nr:hypothetical protein [Ideonella sp.]HEX5682796.1 hypothetical protein [Ideonella sp.]
MRILFSIAGLLVVLAIIGFTVKQQLNALAPPPAPETTAPADTDATAPFTEIPTSAPQQRVQQVQGEIQRALEQGAARASEAER